MRARDRDITFRSTIAAVLSITAAMLAVSLLGIWGARRDLDDIRHRFLRTEIDSLRSHAIRTGARLESELERRDSEGAPELLPQELLPKVEWLRDYWSRVIPSQTQNFAAIVDSDGIIVMHSDDELVGRRLEEHWASGTVDDVGQNDVYYAASEALSRGTPAIDVVIPIQVRDQVLGAYHTGLYRSAFEEDVAVRQRPARRRWMLIMAGTCTVVLLAAWSLHRIHRRSAALQQAVSMAHVKQLSDLGRLVGALAHEIRNPLNAIRLNLHALQSVLLGRAELSQADIQQAVEQSNREIERLSSLMKTMLGYARPDQAVAETVELNTEIEAIHRFLVPIMERDGIELTVCLPDFLVVVSMDPDRLRQILLNLVNNAREAAGEGGRIELTLTAEGTLAEICVADSGPGIAATDRERVFEAFYSTRETGTGLGLALVKRFVDEAGGSVRCEAAEPGDSLSGAVFRVRLPLVATSPFEVATPPAAAEAAGIV